MKKTPIVLIHGLLGSLNYFSPASYLYGVDVHTPDLLGYGPEKDSNSELSLQIQAMHIANYIRNKVGRACCVLGHSVGGAIAMLLAKLEPELVKLVISVEGNFTLNDAFWSQTIAQMEEGSWAAD